MAVVSPTNPAGSGSNAEDPSITLANFATFVNNYWNQNMPSGSPWTAALVNAITGISLTALTVFQNYLNTLPAGLTPAQIIADTILVSSPMTLSLSYNPPAPVATAPSGSTIFGTATFDEWWAYCVAKNSTTF
jgi:hypothetical protein